jgi:L-alanine-DL-glutamate epimerase-like enolase superfamily enzyme
VARRGIRDLKVKVGAASVAADIERLLAIHQAVPQAQLLLDANGGYSVDQAIDLLAQIEQTGLPVVLLEQPVAAADRAGQVVVAKRAQLPICADESARSAADVFWLAESGAAQAVNLKLMKSGLWESLAMYHVARAAGLGLMIGGMVEGSLAMSVSAHFAAGLGGFAYVDLDTPLFIADHPFVGGFAQQGDTLSLGHVVAGHGVSLR